MAHITESDYAKMADAVADDLVKQRIPLNDSIRKLASSAGMSTEQIRRLCETSNNTTFNKLFQSKDKTAADRIIEFDVADAEKILAESIKEASCVDAPEEVVYYSEYRSLAESDPAEETTKIAFELRPTAVPNPEVDRRTVRKTLDYLRHEKIASELMYNDTLHNLKRRFTHLYQDVPFETFEKHAVALHGERAVLPLTDLRNAMRKPGVNYNIDILQKTAGFVDDSKLEYSLLAEAVVCREKIATMTASIARLEELK